MGHEYQLLSVNIKGFVIVKSMVIRGISFSHVKQKGFGKKILSHSGEIFFHVYT